MMLSQMLTKDKESVQYAAENLTPQVSTHTHSAAAQREHREQRPPTEGQTRAAEQSSITGS